MKQNLEIQSRKKGKPKDDAWRPAARGLQRLAKWYSGDFGVDGKWKANPFGHGLTPDIHLYEEMLGDKPDAESTSVLVKEFFSRIGNEKKREEEKN